jgi:hypothetical protein
METLTTTKSHAQPLFEVISLKVLGTPFCRLQLIVGVVDITFYHTLPMIPSSPLYYPLHATFPLLKTRRKIYLWCQLISLLGEH